MKSLFIVLFASICPIAEWLLKNVIGVTKKGREHLREFNLNAVQCTHCSLISAVNIRNTDN